MVKLVGARSLCWAKCNEVEVSPIFHPTSPDFDWSQDFLPLIQMQIAPDPTILKELSSFKMPYGKYKGTAIIRIPVHYLEWMASQGFPSGKLGMLLSTAHVKRLHQSFSNYSQRQTTFRQIQSRVTPCFNAFYRRADAFRYIRPYIYLSTSIYIIIH